MQNEFLITLATTHDKIVQIFNHYNIVYPDTKLHSKKILDLGQNHILVLNQKQSIGSENKDKIWSYDLIDKSRPNEIKLNISQYENEQSRGEVKIGVTDYHSYISQKDANLLFDKYEIEKTVDKVSQKLQEVLDYDFISQSPQRKIFTIESGATLYISEKEERVQMDFKFCPLSRNNLGRIDGKYDYSVLKDSLAIFQGSSGASQTSAFFQTGTMQEVIKQFNDFNQKVNSIPEDIFVYKIQRALDFFKMDLSEIKNIVDNLENKNKPKP